MSWSPNFCLPHQKTHWTEKHCRPKIRPLNTSSSMITLTFIFPLVVSQSGARTSFTANHISVQDWSLQRPSKYTSLKQSFKTRPQIENEDVTWSSQYNLPCTKINERRASSLQEVELDGWFLILHVVLKTRTIQFMHKFNMNFAFHFYILGLTSWIWTNPSKWNSYEGFNLEHRITYIEGSDGRLSFVVHNIWAQNLELSPQKWSHSLRIQCTWSCMCNLSAPIPGKVWIWLPQNTRKNDAIFHQGLGPLWH